MISLCNGWEFAPVWADDILRGGGTFTEVRLPHTVKEVPLHYASPADYEMICGYRRHLDIPASLAGKRLFLQFDGAAHIATVYVNGHELLTHRCGYTSFRCEITEFVAPGGANTVAVRLDCTENPEVPPFGFVIDYLTYGGLYREVWLDVREKNYIEDVYVTTPSTDSVKVSTAVSGTGDVHIRILDGERVLAVGTGTQLTLSGMDNERWSPDSPKLYTCEVSLVSNGQVSDVQCVTFGFRTVEFRADGLYLNGKKTFMRGLNRHQCWPYMGYAAAESLQREDARILKEELQCNAVRTSHYPQSQHFIDECDRRGLLVFTEIPGWQHIGDDAWKEQAVENTREMVLQYRNHPSVVLWGVRINESVDDDGFYSRTNAVAHELDPSRPTSGVRFLEKSHLLEDVYAYNDFSHNGSTPGCKPKKKVMKDMSKALIISECNGHMYPTKSFDTWEKRQEHALRHARVHDGAMADGEHAGVFGWCMFDYPTHKDFGSGDRICYHGVMDAFRNPKLAGAFYASQGDGRDVLEVGSSMDIGDYPAGNTGDIWLFTNADEVELYKNGNFVTTFRPTGWKGLKHPPIKADDTIGCLLETQEGFTGKKAELLHRCLVSAGKYGLAAMPAADFARMGWCMLRYGLSYADGVALYGKYVGNWGGEATVWRFDAKRGGRVVASQTRCPGRALHVEAQTSSTVLTEGNTYDMAAVRIQIRDEYGNTAVYAQLPVKLTLHGDAELIGPNTITAEGGMCGTYIRSVGRAGKASLTISTAQTEPVTVEFEIRRK